MNLFEAIQTRRSIRRFSDTPIDEGALAEILRLAGYAPSASDARPWRFLVLCDREKLRAAAGINPFGQMADKASCGIIVLGDLFREKQNGFWVQDCSACTTTLLLAAHGMGIGAVWTGIYPVRERVVQFSELIDAPQSIVPFSMVLLGNSEQRLQRIADRIDVREIYYDSFGNTRFPSIE